MKWKLLSIGLVLVSHISQSIQFTNMGQPQISLVIRHADCWVDTTAGIGQCAKINLAGSASKCWRPERATESSFTGSYEFGINPGGYYAGGEDGTVVIPVLGTLLGYPQGFTLAHRDGGLVDKIEFHDCPFIRWDEVSRSYSSVGHVIRVIVNGKLVALKNK